MTIKFFYDEDLHGENGKIHFDLSLSGNAALSLVPTTSVSLTYVPDDNEGAFYYDDSMYSTADTIFILAIVIVVLAWIMFIVSLFLRRKFVGVEMMSVLQVAYIALFSFTELNPVFRSFGYAMQFINGFNFYFNEDPNVLDSHPVQLNAIGLFCQYWKNFNMSFLLLLIAPIVALVALILAKTVHKVSEKGDRDKNIAKKALG